MTAAGPSAMLLLGLLGTAHCVGMCGPLVLALPAKTGRVGPQLLYHLGRLTTYTLVCGALGAAGALATGWDSAAGEPSLGDLLRAQILLSLLAASLMLLLGLARLGIVREPRWLGAPIVTRLPGFGRVRAAAIRGRSLAMLPLGLLLGLLPCGLSYGAFAAALTAESPLVAAAMGLAFGIGTLPGLLLLGTAFSRLVRRHGAIVDAAAGVLLVGFGILVAADALAALLS